MENFLDFELPIIELRKKILDLKEFNHSKGIDLSNEIKKLEDRLQALEKEIYKGISPWDRVQISRHHNRPTCLDYIKELFTDFLELHGDRVYGEDSAIVGGIGRFEGKPVTIIGHQRGKDTKDNLYRNFGMPHPEGYRKALRLMKQAEKFQRPIITFIDTKGAYPGKAAEERGQSQAIAQNLFEMVSLEVPIISVLIGEGGSGGALGIGVCNHLHILENSTYSVISPEGAAALLWKDASKAKEAADTMKITAYDLKKLGVVDKVISEIQGGAHKDTKKQAIEIKKALRDSLTLLSELSNDELVTHRYNKYRKMGQLTYSDETKPERVLVSN
ncbi:acetyl-CoA carboxylase carboxyl transferase subunit alpha [Priestia sp. FSL P4-0332]|uniref:acetyl-CoA carboxylase carboxyl transferase subunit alpha n=1 Tax=Priestia sp. FSL P4-0332 TaxID=2921634 RepID=UPI0030F989A4